MHGQGNIVFFLNMPLNAFIKQNIFLLKRICIAFNQDFSFIHAMRVKHLTWSKCFIIFIYKLLIHPISVTTLCQSGSGLGLKPIPGTQHEIGIHPECKVRPLQDTLHTHFTHLFTGFLRAIKYGAFKMI